MRLPNTINRAVFGPRKILVEIYFLSTTLYLTPLEVSGFWQRIATKCVMQPANAGCAFTLEGLSL
jgi:hypothetical protein